MAKIDLLAPTETWLHAMRQVQHELAIDLDEAVEHYLLVTLQHQLQNNHFEDHVVAVEFLKLLQGEVKAYRPLKNLADHCLLMSGFFPERSYKLGGDSMGLVIDVGRHAYSQLAVFSSGNNEHQACFAQMGREFVQLMDVMLLMQHRWQGRARLDSLMANELMGYNSVYAKKLMI